MKFCREGKFPASLRDTPLDFAAKKNPAAFCRILKRFSVGDFLASREEFFRVSCSLTAEAGRISRGCLGPSAKRPGSVFSMVPASCSSFLRLITSRPPDFIAALVRGHPLPLRRLYLRAGDFHHASGRGWSLPGISPVRGGGNQKYLEFKSRRCARVARPGIYN